MCLPRMLWGWLRSSENEGEVLVARGLGALKDDMLLPKVVRWKWCLYRTSAPKQVVELFADTGHIFT